MSSDRDDQRAAVAERVDAVREQVLESAVALIRARSENPPGDTTEAAQCAARILRGAAGAEVETLSAEAPIANVVARLKGKGPGRRLVFNGHLDTFPAGDADGWSVAPFGATVRGGKLYGRGAADMKGGLACSIGAFLALGAVRDLWGGELVATFAGDEETMGGRGTEYLLDNVPYASGDAMISGDAGSPAVLRFGEKGFLWLDLKAEGRAAHGAHVHLGVNAIERLMDVLAELRDLSGPIRGMPESVADAIERAKGVSEGHAGEGESTVLKSVTLNIGAFRGGSSANLVPDRAEAALDVRIPPGVSVADVEERIRRAVGSREGVTCRTRRASEANWTDPEHEIVQLALKNAQAVLGERAVVNMRVGASDSRHYRFRGVPTVVCGLTPYNMGAPDEHVLLEELYAVARIHTMTAFEFLTARTG